MLKIDGSKKSGSGTILRLSIALASILGEDLHLYNIRKRRRQPGLRPQHLEAVLTAAKLADAEIEGVSPNSQEIWFRPGRIVGGRIDAEIGTAGSIPMLLLTVLPICIYADGSVQVHVTKGGTDVRYAPTINYMKQVLLPTLGKTGIKSSLKIHRYGYYPKGMGEITLTVQTRKKLSSLQMEEFGELEKLSGVSVCTSLRKRRVADRQADTARKYLEARGFVADIDVFYDESNPIQKGSSLVLWAETDRKAIIGSDAIGEIRKSSEAVGSEAAKKILKELKSKATVDINLADMLVPYVALAEGDSVYLTRSMTEHLETNIWLTQKILGTEFKVKRKEDRFRIESSGS